MTKTVRISNEAYQALEQLQRILFHKRGYKPKKIEIVSEAIYRYWKEVVKE